MVAWGVESSGAKVGGGEGRGEGWRQQVGGQIDGGADIAASCHVLPKPSDQLAIWQGFGKNHKQTTQSFGSVDQPKRL